MEDKGIQITVTDPSDPEIYYVPNDGGESLADSQPPILADQTAAGDQPAPPPGFLRWLGLIAILIGLLICVANSLVVLFAIQKLNSHGAGPISIQMLWINMGLGIAMGGLLFLAGVGLTLHQRWGRFLCFVYFVLVTLCLSYMGVNAKLSGYIASVEAIGNTSMMGREEYLAGAAPFATPFGVLLCVFMLLPVTRAWAGRRPLPAPYAGPSRLSISAIFSMVLAFLGPCLLVTPIFAFLTGLFSLRRIRRSEGQLKGEPFAWLGVGCSTMFFMFLAGIALSIGVACAMTDPQDILEGFKMVEEIENPNHYDSSAPPW